MKKLKIKLEHCYGIKDFSTEFDFETGGNVFALYAPNGSMKTSLANTFRDISQKKESSDRIWKANETIRMITDEDDNPLNPESIFVIEPYNEGYRSDRISTLLVNDGLRVQYEDIHKEIDEKMDVLLAEIGPSSGVKNGIKEEIAYAITHNPKNFFIALGRVREEVDDGVETPLGEVTYTDIFNPKIEPTLRDPKFMGQIEEYILKYDELISKSTFFQKGVFTHNNAADIAKNLNTNGFFKAGHSLYICIEGKKVEVDSLERLTEAIETEKNAILADEDLRKRFDKINELLKKNADLRKFRTCLEDNQVVLVELANIELLRQKLWIEYLIRAKTTYLDLLSSYNDGKDKIADIIEKAKGERTRWAEVINIYNQRFSVPFVVRMDNQEDVILRSDTPNIRFEFLADPDDQNSEISPIEEDTLKEVLSNGEQRALYILNIIFEVEARKNANQPTLFIVDDIADSFDYKNKYAIIEYLKEISEKSCFQQIILSHNFDFYRTISGRLHLKRQNRLLASKEGGKITVQQEHYQKSPFVHWRTHLNNNTMLVASIPFIRNITEFSGDDVSFKEFIPLLHIRPETNQIKISDLESLIKDILRGPPISPLNNANELVKDLIYQVAREISDNTSENTHLEEKVALSIAIRLKAEEFMIGKIGDDAFWHGIPSNQTITLINRFKQDFSTETDNIRLLEQVNLMTPENIHLNSFMYEPILDMSAQHLKKLFGKINSL